MPFLRFALACCRALLRISTSCLRLVVKAFKSRSFPLGLRAERHEAGDQFGIDPGRFNQSALALPEDSDLRLWEILRLNPGRLQARPKPPFAAPKLTRASLPLATSSSSEWPSFVFDKRSWRLSVRQ